jgi:3-mercaptopyruvate sulfurtransferase SseA
MKITCTFDEVEGLNASEIKTILDKDKTGQYLFIDVRQPEEYETGHIPESLLITRGVHCMMYDCLCLSRICYRIEAI